LIYLVFRRIQISKIGKQRKTEALSFEEKKWKEKRKKSNAYAHREKENEEVEEEEEERHQKERVRQTNYIWNFEEAKKENDPDKNTHH